MTCPQYAQIEADTGTSGPMGTGNTLGKGKHALWYECKDENQGRKPFIGGEPDIARLLPLANSKAQKNKPY